MSKKRTSKECSKCLENKNITKDYYLASNKLLSEDGRMVICKECLRSLVDMQKPETLVEAMRLVDRPFLRTTYEDSLSNRNPFGEYMRMLATRQNRDKSYLDSELSEKFEEYAPKTNKDLSNSKNIEDVIEFKVTPDLVVKWGSGYEESEIYLLEQFYQSMVTANEITTPQHMNSLKLICKLNLEQNKALDTGRINDFKNLNTQYNKTLQDSGFRPIDNKSRGESSGIRTFSQIWEEIERDGFIEPYPYQERQDIVDQTIMYMGNYTRQLVNMSSMTEPPKDTPKVNRDDEE